MPSLAYVTGFLGSTNYVSTATGGSGADAFTAWAIIVPRGSYASSIIAGRTPNSAPTVSGWALVLNNAGGVSMQFRDGVGLKVSPISTLAAGDIGKAVMFHGVIDVANSIVRLYRAGVEVGSGTASSGSLVTGGTAHAIGSRNGGSNSIGASADHGGHGYVGGVMTPVEIAAHYAACVSAAACVAPSVAGTIRNWDAIDYAAPSWLDDIAAQAQTTTGTLSTGSLVNPVWA